MLVRYFDNNQINPRIKKCIDRIHELKYRYYASEIVKRMIRKDSIDLDFAVRRAMAISKLSGIPVQKHFILIFRSDMSGLRRDWKLTELACGLVILSYNSPNEDIGRLQDEFMFYLEAKHL